MCFLRYLLPVVFYGNSVIVSHKPIQFLNILGLLCSSFLLFDRFQILLLVSFMQTGVYPDM